MVISTTGGFPTSIPDAYFKSELLKFGELSLLYRRFAKKEKLPPGNGKTWKANRYKRIELPMSALVEGVTPSDTPFDIEQVSCIASQHGIVVTLSDVLQLTVDHPVLQEAIKLVRDAMERLDSELICEVLLAGTNVLYADGSGGASVPTARSALDANDIVSSETWKRVVNQLEFPSDVAWGSAPKVNGAYWVILHRKMELDMLADTTWKDMAIRLGREDLEKGMVNRWLGCEFYTTNFGPKFTNLGTTNAGASPTALNAGIVAQASPAGTFAAESYDFTWSRRHKHRRFEEDISGVIAVTPGASNSIKFYAPTNSAYVYSLYSDRTGDTNGTKRLLVANVAASSITDIIDPPSASAAVCPVAPASGVSVYAAFAGGRDAYAVVDLDNMEAGVSEAVRSDSDPLKQRRKVAAKFFEGGIILADNNLVRVEATSKF